MRFILAILVFGAVGLMSVNLTIAQSRRPISADEYIQSTSPLQTGGNVTSRTQPGVNSQKLVSIAQLPERQSENSIQGVFRQASANNQSSRVSAQRPAEYNVYPYPAPTNPLAARLTPSQSIAAATLRQPANGSARQTAYQSSSLNNNPIRTAQNCNCAPGTTGSFQVPATAVPNLNVQVPQGRQFVQTAPLNPPQGRLFVPGTAFNGQTISPTATFTGGQTAYAAPSGTWFQSWYQPIVSGNGAYQPIVDWRGFKPGTYLGRGIVGQPTAYVGGQPVRNFMRYIFP